MSLSKFKYDRSNTDIREKFSNRTFSRQTQAHRLDRAYSVTCCILSVLHLVRSSKMHILIETLHLKRRSWHCSSCLPTIQCKPFDAHYSAIALKSCKSQHTVTRLLRMLMIAAQQTAFLNQESWCKTLFTNTFTVCAHSSHYEMLTVITVITVTTVTVQNRGTGHL